MVFGITICSMISFDQQELSASCLNHNPENQILELLSK